MIHQFFKVKVFASFLMAVCLMFLMSGFNQMSAQSSKITNANPSSGSGNSSVTDESVYTHDYSKSELASYKEDLIGLIDQAKSSNTLPEYEVAIRVEYYQSVFEYLYKGATVEQATSSAINPAEDTADLHVNGDKVDLEQLADETENILK